jgi:hypothetical protein
MERRKKTAITISSLLLTGCLILLSACNLKPQRVAPGDIQGPPFVPPTIVPTATPTKPAPKTSQSWTSGDCTNQLTFKSDVTIPDGTVVVPGSTMDKRWEVENSGTCNWDADYHLKLIAGPSLGAKTEQVLFPARSGSQATISVLFTAPNDPGKYRSAWQAFDPNGQAFGDAFYIEVVVTAPTP